MENISQFIKKNTESMYALLKELCNIPAPSHHEEQRAEFCKSWFDKTCGEGAYIDSAKNVIFPYKADGKSNMTVYVAHTDTVFPDTEPMPYSDDGEIVRSPGVGDDTASLVVMMHMAKYFVTNDIPCDDGILFVANSCEEGLGNLKGTRQIFADFEGRIKQFISFDSNLNVAKDVCVGSHRYKVRVKTEGGHSFLAFGNKNAIAVLSNIINEIYSTNLPYKEGAKVTYNVGGISGGTSVNTIAESAEMLCEYRSDDVELLDFMKDRFECVFESAREEGTEVEVSLIGERPCAAADLDKSEVERLVAVAREVYKSINGKDTVTGSSSTDCNVPLSLSIPALCIGVYKGGGMHTRDEWIEKKSIIEGLEVAIKFGLKLL